MGSRPASRLCISALLFLGALSSGCGCSTVRYLVQAGKGQFELSNRARPIDEVLKDERTPPRTRKLLGEIPDIKRFGESKGIKPTTNYTDYVALDRPAAVWVVSACRKLRFESKTWGFPIVGSFPYLGWFDLKSAREFASELEKEGDWDVDVRPAGAYSTLGWFRDAVLSSMISEGAEARGDLANVILHESVHATLYLSGQAYFNESIASYVADRLTPEYLAGAGGRESGELQAYEKSEADGEGRRKGLHEAYRKLADLYGTKLGEEEKLARKAVILAELKKKYGFRRDLNNASLVQFKTYQTATAEFDAVFNACGKDWGRFWKAMRTLKSESFGASQTESIGPVLLELAKRCPELNS